MLALVGNNIELDVSWAKPRFLVGQTCVLGGVSSGDAIEM